jgi:hypothetical protein
MTEEDDDYDECPHCRDTMIRHVISSKYSGELGVGFVKWQWICWTCGHKGEIVEEET